MSLLTVFTPTYNRRDTLPRLYESLLAQTCKDFCWLIIDDGSADHTGELIEKWQQENQIAITYVYKENGGLHTGYNAAIERLTTPLAVCIDSDDYMPPDGVESICECWKTRGSEALAGMIGLDADLQGKIIAGLPQQDRVNSIDLLMGKYPVGDGDRKIVMRSDLYRSVAPMDSFPGEKNFNPHYMHLQIAKQYDLLVLDKVLCIVDYQPDGMSRGIYRQYVNSPRSFAQTRRLYLSFENTSALFRFRQCVHYVSSSILARDRHFLKTSPRKLLTFLAILPGAMLSLYIKHKAK